MGDQASSRQHTCAPWEEADNTLFQVGCLLRHTDSLCHRFYTIWLGQAVRHVVSGTWSIMLWRTGSGVPFAESLYMSSHLPNEILPVNL